MNKKMTMILGGAAVGAALLFAAPTAGADPNTPTPGPSNNSWGQTASGCNQAGANCYANGGSRGSYVSGVAQDPSTGFDQTPPDHGYGGQLHDLAHPGNSNPQGTPGTPGGATP